MNVLNTILSALGGTGAVAALVAAVISHLKARTAALERKSKSECGHEETHKLLEEIKAGQEDIIAALQNENAQLRADAEAKDKKITKIERDLSNALAMKEAARQMRIEV